MQKSEQFGEIMNENLQFKEGDLFDYCTNPIMYYKIICMIRSIYYGEGYLEIIVNGSRWKG